MSSERQYDAREVEVRLRVDRKIREFLEQKQGDRKVPGAGNGEKIEPVLRPVPNND
jgi:hypothetical protein